MSRSRRSVLGAVGGVVLASVSGCLGGGGGGGGTTTTTQGTPADAPTLEFRFDYDAEAGEVNVTLLNIGGNYGRLSKANTARMTYGVGEASKTWELPATVGDRVTVSEGVEPGATVEIVWTAPSGGSTTVGSFQVPSS